MNIFVHKSIIFDNKEVRSCNTVVEGGELSADGQTCDNPCREVDVDDAGGEGGKDHSQRGEEATHHHHWTTAKAVHQHTAKRAWTKCNALSQLCVSMWSGTYTY